MPRTLLHDAFGHHQDIGQCTYPDKSADHIHKQGFSCDVQQLVVKLPYTFVLSLALLPMKASLFEPQVFEIADPLLTFSAETSGRAPPSM